MQVAEVAVFHHQWGVVSEDIGNCACCRDWKGCQDEVVLSGTNVQMSASLKSKREPRRTSFTIAVD